MKSTLVIKVEIEGDDPHIRLDPHEVAQGLLAGSKDEWIGTDEPEDLETRWVSAEWWRCDLCGGTGWYSPHGGEYGGRKCPNGCEAAS